MTANAGKPGLWTTNSTIAPPLIIRASELDEVTTTLREAVAEVAG